MDVLVDLCTDPPDYVAQKYQSPRRGSIYRYVLRGQNELEYTIGYFQAMSMEKAIKSANEQAREYLKRRR